jgi:predicted transcriptional regulator of viral defense system
MSNSELLENLLQKNKGFLRTSKAVQAGVSRSYLSQFVCKHGLKRVAHGLYASQDAWPDGLYVIQFRYPQAVFSHETALYLLNLADREPTNYSVTFKAGTRATELTKEGIKVYKVKADLFDRGISNVESPAGHELRVYNPERTICDLLRSRSSVEIQDLQTGLQAYIKSEGRNIPLLMRYANEFSVDTILRRYLEVLL